jgi:granule-bound starch synthase
VFKEFDRNLVYFFRFGFAEQERTMASLTASHFAPRNSYVSSHGSETTENFGQIGLRSQSMTHSGLRSLNMVDKLQFKTQAFARKSVKKAYATGNDTSGKIVCLQGGMTVVFVATEVAPWSKTGGLGDVLGGLPPAMAVSRGFLILSFIFEKCQARLVFDQFYCGIVVQARGHRVMTISPRFDQYKDAWDTCEVAQVICHSFSVFKRAHLYFLSVLCLLACEDGNFLGCLLK